MRLEIVDAAVHETRSIEDAMPAVHHVIVERNHHQRGIGDDAPELAGVERGELYGLPSAQRAQVAKDFVGAEHLKVEIQDSHTDTLHPATGRRGPRFTEPRRRSCWRRRYCRILCTARFVDTGRVVEFAPRDHRPTATRGSPLALSLLRATAREP